MFISFQSSENLIFCAFHEEILNLYLCNEYLSHCEILQSMTIFDNYVIRLLFITHVKFVKIYVNLCKSAII